MKVILAGYSKTGTKSMNSALTELGYNVYDFIDHFWYHEKHWEKIFKDGGTIEDFKEMYQDVDAVVDVPAYLFWEEISEAFPEAKIILTIREESSWAFAFEKQLKRYGTAPLFWIWFQLLCPSVARIVKLTQLYSPLAYGCPLSSFTLKYQVNQSILKKRYRQHNAYVKQNAPKDKLLIYSVKDGWEPLCKFLGKEIPNKPFPWKNKDSEAIKPMMMDHLYGRQVKKEFSILICGTVVIIGILLYWCFSIYFTKS